MTREFEYISYNEADRIAILENRAAELERRLLAVLPPDGPPGWGNVATPRQAGAPAGEPAAGAASPPPAAGVRYAYEVDAYGGDPGDHQEPGHDPDPGPFDDGPDPDGPDGGRLAPRGGRKR